MESRSYPRYLSNKLDLKPKFRNVLDLSAIRHADLVFDEILYRTCDVSERLWEYKRWSGEEVLHSDSAAQRIDEQIQALHEELPDLYELRRQAWSMKQRTRWACKQSLETLEVSIKGYLDGQLTMLARTEGICEEMLMFWAHSGNASQRGGPEHPLAGLPSLYDGQHREALVATVKILRNEQDHLLANYDESYFNAMDLAPTTAETFIPKFLRKLYADALPIEYELARIVDEHYNTISYDDEDNETILCAVTGRSWPREMMEVAMLVPEYSKTPDWAETVFGPGSYYATISLRNTLRVHRDVKRALDMSRITLLPIPAKSKSNMPTDYMVHIVDNSILDETIPRQMSYEPVSWADVAELSKLEFANVNRPGLRNIFYHTFMALCFASWRRFEGWAHSVKLFALGLIWPHHLKQSWMSTTAIELMARPVHVPRFKEAALVGRQGSRLRAMICWQCMYKRLDKYDEAAMKTEAEDELDTGHDDEENKEEFD